MKNRRKGDFLSTRVQYISLSQLAPNPQQPRRSFDEAALPIQHADNMQHAVELARAAAKPGDIIILSPASASFDLYPNFEVRGREFKKIVNALK